MRALLMVAGCSEDNSLNWYVDFTTMMDKAFISGKEIILLGDFNIDLISPT